MKEIGMYIHIPFCKQKCFYCDFCSFAGKEDLINEYIKWLKYEIIDVAKANAEDVLQGRDEKLFVKTIYIGGGTPSIVDSKDIVDIVENIKLNYNVLDNAEITIEVNPGTVNLEKLQDYYSCGINRISIGLQSTYDTLLKQIGRIHSYNEFLDTYRLARQVGFKNINVDLMLGLPNQTLQEIQNSVKEILALEPEHISVYSLILEEKTKLYKMVENGNVALPDEDVERNMYWNVKKILEENGYIHYEISNFAKEGYYSKHNLDCWNQKEYIGYGVAAHSYTNGIRYSNVNSIEEYIENYKNEKQEDNFVFHEKQNKEIMQKEFMMLGLRKIEGVNIQDFKNKFVDNPIYVYHNELDKLVNKELIEIDGNYIKLTNKGLDFANIVWEEFV